VSNVVQLKELAKSVNNFFRGGETLGDKGESLIGERRELGLNRDNMGPGFDSQVVPLFHWASCLFTLPPQFLSSKKLGYNKREFSVP